LHKNADIVSYSEPIVGICGFAEEYGLMEAGSKDKFETDAKIAFKDPKAL
jgi:hypothetical protein